MVSFRFDREQDALDRAKAGLTSLDEILRVINFEEFALRATTPGFFAAITEALSAAPFFDLYDSMFARLRSSPSASPQTAGAAQSEMILNSRSG
jgi:hypothetical protein